MYEDTLGQKRPLGASREALTGAGVEEQPVCSPHAVLDLFELLEVHLDVLLPALSSSGQLDLQLRLTFRGGRRVPLRPAAHAPRSAAVPLVNQGRGLVGLARLEGVVGSGVVTHHAARGFGTVLGRAGRAGPALRSCVESVPVVVFLTRIHCRAGSGHLRGFCGATHSLPDTAALGAADRTGPVQESAHLTRPFAAVLGGLGRADAGPGAGIRADEQAVVAHGVTPVSSAPREQFLCYDGCAGPLRPAHGALNSRRPVFIRAVLTRPLHTQLCHDGSAHSLAHTHTRPLTLSLTRSLAHTLALSVTLARSLFHSLTRSLTLTLAHTHTLNNTNLHQALTLIRRQPICKHKII